MTQKHDSSGEPPSFLETVAESIGSTLGTIKSKVESAQQTFTKDVKKPARKKKIAGKKKTAKKSKTVSKKRPSKGKLSKKSASKGKRKAK